MTSKEIFNYMQWPFKFGKIPKNNVIFENKFLTFRFQKSFKYQELRNSHSLQVHHDNII